MGCGAFWTQINQLSRAITGLRRSGFMPSNPALQALERQRAKLQAQVTKKFPRITLPLVRIAGLSPGEVRVWFDVEAGWMAEARPEPGAPPIYRQITQGQAEALLRTPPDPAVAHALLEPDPYIGE